MAVSGGEREDLRLQRVGGSLDGGLLRSRYAHHHRFLNDSAVSSSYRCPLHMTSRSSAPGGELEDYTMELIQRIDELREKRDEITKMLQNEEEEKASIQKDLVVLTKRLAEIDESLSRKYAYINDYDKTIEDVEAAYGKILESSQALLHVLKSEAIQISNKR